MKISIVVPTYNEKDNIKILIPKIFETFRKNKIDGSLIIVDDNSPDGTSKIVRKFQKRYPIILIVRKKKMGLGSAYITGFKRALKENASIIFEMDADLSHPPEFIPRFINKIEEGYDVVIGARTIAGGKIIGWSIYRKIISKIGNLLGRFLASLAVDDLTSGYRAYRREVLKGINLDEIYSNGYAFQLEMLARCSRKGYKIATIPIKFFNRIYGKSKLSIRDIIEFLMISIKIRFYK